MATLAAEVNSFGSHRGLPAAGRAGRAALAWAAVAVSLCAGCETTTTTMQMQPTGYSVPGSGVLVVLPLADAPGAEASGSGKVICGAILEDLVALGRHNIVHVSDERMRAAIEQTGYAECDCYDPVVAAALGKALGADLVVTGDVMHYGKHQDMTAASVSYLSGSKTHTTHWVSLNVRIVAADDGKVLYMGTGTASSLEGFAKAARPAVQKALRALHKQLKKGS